jgi:hypothetical protein
MMNKGATVASRSEGAAKPQKSSQLNRGIGLVAAAGEVVVAAAMVVTVDEDVDGTDDRRSNVSQLAVGAGAGAAGCANCRRCETGGGRGGRCGARALLAWPLALAAAAFLARMASSVSTYFCTRFSCKHSDRLFNQSCVCNSGRSR